ncbi:probable RNA polymerase II nuclear localization protein SLC7A6OS [Cephus cinctus]|uniref:Probable RNA polymerase II nuclear localization protein SLC7A6OS n=1 Tax=Cephus cinctus TaxID=211228 RepID=A0AAJ7RN71_CEPCN|nr:probable RNA polymerase II nuclear localization protein SLC7A6OS [Cephus cinctus]
MPAVLRVKRRNDDEPLDALLIACKRQKLDVDEKDESKNVPLTAVVKFAGTVKDQEENVLEHIKKTLSKDELTANYKQRVVDINSKARQEAKQISQENRYKVVSCFRSLDTAKNKAFEDKITTVIDIEDTVSYSHPAQSSSEKNDDYVYDLYYTQVEDDMLLDHLVSVHPLNQELVFDTYREPGANTDIECESEDSNSESNWRNDYPDSDHSEGSVGEDDIRSAIKSIKLDDEESDLSSEDDFVYGVDEGDVNSFGYKYAKYKARIKAQMEDNDVNNEDDDGNNSQYSGVYNSDELEDD